MLRTRLIACAAAIAALCTATPTLAQLRPDVAGFEAAVVADHPIAAAAGAHVLRQGGNAIDAAITMAAVLAVVRPHVAGVGGDAVLLYRGARDGQVIAVNGSGRAGELGTPTALRTLGHDAVPAAGLLAVTVPGAVRLWADALRRFGSIGLDSALAPAIRLAEHGFPVTSRLAAEIDAARARIAGDAELRAIYLPGGEPPPVGAMLQQRLLAESLRLVARDGPDVLYVGALARRIDALMVEQGGLLRIEDLAAHSSTWQQPVATRYLGYRVFTTPPASQGVALLMQMNIAEQFDLSQLRHNSAAYLHMLIEASRFVDADRDRFAGDPAFTELPLDALLSAEYARDRAEAIRQVAHVVVGVGDDDGGTGGTGAFLGVVDRMGSMVAMSLSLYEPFGSGRAVPGTGIVLHNRGAQFSLDPTSPSVIAPRKRVAHTLAPALALRPDGSPFMVFGAAGGNGQAQTLVQLFNNVALFGMTPQQAVEAPRAFARAGGAVTIEDGAASAIAELLARGHTVRTRTGFAPPDGAGQIILVLPNGARFTAADPRGEGYGIAW